MEFVAFTLPPGAIKASVRGVDIVLMERKQLFPSMHISSLTP
jgi:hypothetical protein